MRAIYVLCALLLLAAGSLWPEDIPWINDEPVLINTAVHANETHFIPSAGIPGSVGLPYGPLPTWIYQGLLLFGHELSTLVILKSLLTALVTFGICFWLARELEWSLIPPLWILASPYFWFFGRMLWDNVFLVPLSALFFSAAILFLRRPRLPTLSVVALSGTAMGLVHLMAVPLLLAFSITAILRKRSWLQARWKGIALILFICGLLCAPYLLFAFSHYVPGGHHTLANLRPGSALANALLGFQLFTSWGFIDRYAAPLYDGGIGWMFWVVNLCTGIALVLCLRGLVSFWRERRTNDLSLFFGVCVLLFFFTTLFMFLPHHKHYLVGIWPVFFVLIEKGVKGKGLPVIQTALLFSVVVGTLCSNHLTAGNRNNWYGTVLREQIRIAKLLPQDNSLDGIQIEVENVKLYPHALRILAHWYGRTERPNYSLLRYRDSDARSGWLELK